MGAQIEPRFAVISIISLMLAPFVIAPSAAPVLGIAFTRKELKALIAHTQALIERGLGIA